ncbi:ribosomal protein S6 kinase delta-1 [Sergentomyia squamirostris]
MATAAVGWVHDFAINEISRHKKGYTIYKITSIVYPKCVPEALSCVTVWKRFSEIKKLQREIEQKHRALKLSGKVPRLEDRHFFRRFDEEVINERREYILQLLDFVAMYPSLYTCEVFVKFLRGGHTPNSSPSHQGNIAKICKDLAIPFQSEIALIDPTRDSEVDSDIFPDSASISTDFSAERRIYEGSDFSRRGSVASEEGSTRSLSRESSVISNHPDNFNYLFDAEVDFNQAMRAEVLGQYQESLMCYKKGIDTLLQGAEHDHDRKRQLLAENKASTYHKIAEKLCENHIDRENGIPQKNLKRSTTESYLLERPLALLSRYKVVKIIETVMQVQNTVDNKIYIMKGIDKLKGSELFLGAYLPTKVPYMVPLISYFKSHTTIFLLLKPAPGGKLYDFIMSFTPEKPIREIQRKPVRIEVRASATKPKIEVIEKKEESIPDTENVQEVPRPPSFDILSKDMDVLDLVHCSRSLLNSVSSTLEHSKVIGNEVDPVDLPDLPSILPVIPEEEDQCAEEEEEKEEIPHPQSKRYPLPEGCIRQWASELVIAVESLHLNRVICCDLHPNNLLLGESGQILLTYFYYRPNTSILLKPTALAGKFVAPERPLTEMSDWWSVGVILYEILTQSAFITLHPGTIYNYYEVQYPEMELSDEARSLLDGLLRVNPGERFGFDEIQTHAFFRDVDWEDVRSRGKASHSVKNLSRGNSFD